MEIRKDKIMRYYDTLTHTETRVESDTTIPMTDDRVKDFFQPINPDTHRVRFVNDLPIVEPIPQPTQAEIDALLIAKENEAAKADLEKIDLESIRSLREWVASQPGAPQFIIDKENAAQAARARLK